jgi:hypothetical protein
MRRRHHVEAQRQHLEAVNAEEVDLHDDIGFYSGVIYIRRLRTDCAELAGGTSFPPLISAPTSHISIMGLRCGPRGSPHWGFGRPSCSGCGRRPGRFPQRCPNCRLERPEPCPRLRHADQRFRHMCHTNPNTSRKGCQPYRTNRNRWPQSCRPVTSRATVPDKSGVSRAWGLYHKCRRPSCYSLPARG